MQPDGSSAIRRDYAPADVERLAGSFRIRHTLAEMGAARLRHLLETEPFVPTLGALNLRRFSPVYRAGHIRARLLVGCSTWDYWCPPEQPREMKRARPMLTTVMFLRGAARTTPTNFTHANVTSAALQSWRRAEVGLLAATIGGRQARGKRTRASW